jgi:hypothetical protein
MALPIPNLDDRTFNDLINEARALIPVYDKDWTNHNPSDPGITLVELFAWLIEMVIYRVDQVPEANYRNFLKLIGIDYLFCWDQIREQDGNDQTELNADELKLVAFLEDNYGLTGLKMAAISKNGDGNTIFITQGNTRITFKRTKLTNGNYQVVLDLGRGVTEELKAIPEAECLFNWDDVPGNETYRLLELLVQNYATSWVETAAVWKSVDQKNITITNFFNTITIKRSDDPENPNRIEMEFDIDNRFQFQLQKEPVVRFDWNKVPGDHGGRVLDLLSQNFGVVFSGKPEITQSANGKMITVKDAEHLILLNINDVKDMVTVTFVVQDEANYQFSTQWNCNGSIDWNSIPGKDNEKLIKFLIQNYGVVWVKGANIQNTGQIIIDKPKDPQDDHDFFKQITLTQLDQRGLVCLDFNAGNVFEFGLVLEPESILQWNKIVDQDNNEIKKLLDFLYQNYSDAYWVKTIPVSVHNIPQQQVEISPADATSPVQDKIILTPSDDGTLVNLTFSRKSYNYEFTVKKKFDNFFSEDLFREKPMVALDWSRIPGAENGRLLDFLSRNYRCAQWVKEAKVSMEDDKVKIYPAPEAEGMAPAVPAGYEILLERFKLADNPDQNIQDDTPGNDQYQIMIHFTVGENYRFTVEKRQESFYSTGLLPEEDKQKLKNYLIENYCLLWVNNAEMICEDTVKTITVFYGDKLVVLRMDENATVANMIFNAGNQYPLHIKRDNNRILVYQKLENDIVRGLRSLNIKNTENRASVDFRFAPPVNRVITTGDFETATMKYMNQLRPNLAGRVICVDNRDLEYAGPRLDKPGHISMIIIPNQYQGGEFCWDNIPDKPQDRNDLLQFLMKVYQADWIRKAQVRKSAGAEKIVVFDHCNAIKLTMDDYQKKVTLTKEAKNPLFCWEQVPGADDYKLLEMLARDYNGDGFSRVDIQKINPSRMKVTLKSNFVADQVITLEIVDTPLAEQLEAEKRILINGEDSLWELNPATGMVIRRVPNPVGYELVARRDMEKRLVIQVEYQYNKLSKKPKVYWDEIPGKSEALFLEILSMIYQINTNENLPWLPNAAVEKSLDGNLIRVSNGDNRITVQTGDTANGRNIPRLMIARDDHLIMLEINGKAMEYQQGANRMAISAKTETIKPLNIYAYCVHEGRPSSLLRSLVYRHLDSKRLITTRVHVVAANFREVRLDTQLVLQKNVNETQILAEAQTKVEQYFDPVSGGPAGRGWPVGRGLYRSEIYGLLEGIPGVDHVSRILIDGQEEEQTLEIGEDQLVLVELTIGTEKRYYE